jgi:probable HAF family extracellular repeat protein
LWRAGTASDLGTIGGNSSAFGLGINDFGRVVGDSAVTDLTAEHATLWNTIAGTTTDLGTLGGANSRAYAINGAGLVVGSSQVNMSDFSVGHATLWNTNDGTITDLFTLGGASSVAKAINSSGQIVGYSYLANSPGMRAAIWTDGVAADLNSFLDASAAGWVLVEAMGINDSGWIAGNAINGDGKQHAFLLTPVPEPQSYALALLGVGVLGWVARRRRYEVSTLSPRIS